MQDSKTRGAKFPQGGQARGGFNQPTSVKDWMRNNPLSTEWITKEADSAMVDYTEKAGQFMAKNGLTNSKIRSIYGEIKRIQMGSFETEKASFLLLRPKVAYAYGRDDRNKGLELFKEIFDTTSVQVTNQKSFINFSNFFEAILAYHKAYGGRD